MGTILATVEKLERDTRETRREVGSRLAIAALSLTVALGIAFAVVSGMTAAGVL